MAAGRPSKYSKELGIEICRRISEGQSVRAICKDPDMPSAATVFFWLLDEDKVDCNLRPDQECNNLVV